MSTIINEVTYQYKAIELTLQIGEAKRVFRVEDAYQLQEFINSIAIRYKGSQASKVQSDLLLAFAKVNGVDSLLPIVQRSRNCLELNHNEVHRILPNAVIIWYNENGRFRLELFHLNNNEDIIKVKKFALSKLNSTQEQLIQLDKYLRA